MKHKNIAIGVVAVIVLVAAVIGVSTMGGKSTNMAGMNDTTSAAVATNAVTIKGYMFSPAAIKVKVGTTVTWTNQDAVNHTITADNSSSDAPSSMDIAQGKSYSFTFNKAGTYTYHCFPHPYMHGTVEVTNS